MQSEVLSMTLIKWIETLSCVFIWKITIQFMKSYYVNVGLLLKGTKWHNRNHYLQSWVFQLYDLELLRAQNKCWPVVGTHNHWTVGQGYLAYITYCDTGHPCHSHVICYTCLNILGLSRIGIETLSPDCEDSVLSLSHPPGAP